MVKRFGFGDYERIDLDTRQSVKLLRHHFLKLLVGYKRNCFENLLRIANFELLPDNLLDKELVPEESLFFFLLSYNFGNPFNAEFSSEVFDTPLVNFLRYVATNQERLAGYESEIVDSDPDTNHRMKINALEKLVPDWKTLKADKDAQMLCKSILSWANEFNLKDEWCLDFAVSVLVHMKCLLKYEPEDFTNYNSAKVNIYFHDFKSKQQNAVNSAVYRMYSDEILLDFFMIDEELEIKPFKFKHKSFEYPDVTYFPNIEKRAKFIKHEKGKFLSLIRDIEEFDDLYKDVNFVAIEKSLNEYCADITDLNSKTEKNYQLLHKLYECKFNSLILFCSVWDSLQMTQEDFVKNALKEVELSFEKIKRMAESLETLKKSDFENALWLYCEKTEKGLPDYYEKTLTKYSDEKHFIWLIDFQVHPVKTFQQIKDEIDIQDNIKVSGIEKGIKKLAKTIGITLRKSPKTGRPKGVVELRKRHRVKK